MTKLLYIGGYGHSGSTLLEYLIAGRPAVMACGEVASCVRGGMDKQNKCTCGFEAKACPVWGFLYSPSSHPERWTHVRLLHILMQRCDGLYSAIVDSSKTAWGSFATPFRLRHTFGPDFVLVHLVREPTAVCWGTLKQKNRRAKRAGRKLYHYTLRCGSTVLGWWLANLSCELFGMIYPARYVRLRYEDLVHSPTETLRGLLEKLLPNVPWNSDGVGAWDNRHQLYGNNIRYQIIAVEDVKEDFKWQIEMPPEYSRVILALSYLLRLRYGY